uniref:Uncharacterized protein n=1 Tax=Ciona intestinalis TaxID=7719 RepID=H2XQG2_CIOIN
AVPSCPDAHAIRLRTPMYDTCTAHLSLLYGESATS